MKITFLGAARTVTGSQHLIEVNGRKLLLDCGLYQGDAKTALKINRHFAYDPKEIDAVVLSHAHIDHCGNLPSLVKKGFSGPIYTSTVTTQLAPLLMMDSGKIQEMDFEYLKMQHRRNGNGAHPIKPLYTMEEARQVAPLFKEVAYNTAFEPIPGVTVHLVEAGHILGSAAIILDVEEDGRQLRLWYSGDIGRWKLPIVRDPKLPFDANYLIMESTYGDSSHEDVDTAYEDLRKVAIATVARGGKLIIPAFAVGRTQDLVYSFHRMFEDGDLPEIPIYVDSPLAVEASKVFMEHPEFFDSDAQELMDETQERALGFDLVTYIESVEESRALNDITTPIIIISASGMATSGRILHHLKNNIGNPKNVILIVSYQAPNTLGRALSEGAREVEIFGKTYERKADVVKLNGFSAHAGQGTLLEYGLASKETLRGIFLVHGEDGPADVLMSRLRENGIRDVRYPKRGTSVEI